MNTKDLIDIMIFVFNMVFTIAFTVGLIFTLVDRFLYKHVR